MNRTALAATLLSALCALALPAAAQHKVKPKPRSVTIETIKPTTVHSGDPITVTGKRLDEIQAVLLGGDSPTIREKTPTKLVFVAPDKEKSRLFKAQLFFLVAGQPLLATKTTIKIVPQSTEVTEEQAPGTMVDEGGTLKVGERKSWPVALENATALEITVTSKGGDVEAKIEPAADGDPPLARATYAGSLTWRVLGRELGARAVTVTLSTDAPHVEYRAVVVRLGGGTRPTPNPKSALSGRAPSR